MFNWCFIGTGRLAYGVASQIEQTGRHKVVSCFSRNYERCSEFASKFGAKPYRSAKEAMLDERVDAVYIVTTHNVHYKYAKEALLLHKPVLCEKAFTVFLKDAEELVKLSKEDNTYLAEAMWTWFAKPANKVKSWIDENKIGKIKEVEFVWNMISYPSSAPRLYDPKRAGGALLDITVYPITYAYRLFGYPIKIEAKGIIENGIDLKDDIILSFNHGIKAHIVASISSPVDEEKMTIIGEKGRIDLPTFHSTNKVSYINDEGGEFFQGESGAEGGNIIWYLDEFDAVKEDVANHKIENDLVPHQASIDVMEIMEEIRHQINLNYDHLEE